MVLNIKRLLTAVLTSAVAASALVTSFPAPVMADGTEYTIAVNYHGENKDNAIDGAEFSIVKAASVNGTYKFDEPFDMSGVDPNDIGTDIKAAAKKLVSCYKNGAKTVTTDSTGKASLDVHNPGLYLVWQTGSAGTAKKYYTSSPMLISVPGHDENGNVVNTVTVEPKTTRIEDKTTTEDDDDDDDDNKTSSYGAINVYKVDADDNNAYLSGAVFSLYKSDGTKVGTYTTNNRGCFGVSYLPYGNYYLIEDKAPDGYVGGTDKINFTLNATTSFSNAYPWNIKVTNTKIKEMVKKTEEDKTVVNKKTGDAGNIPLMAAGIVVSVGVIGCVLYARRRKK